MFEGRWRVLHDGQAYKRDDLGLIVIEGTTATMDDHVGETGGASIEFPPVTGDWDGKPRSIWARYAFLEMMTEARDMASGYAEQSVTPLGAGSPWQLEDIPERMQSIVYLIREDSAAEKHFVELAGS